MAGYRWTGADETPRRMALSSPMVTQFQCSAATDMSTTARDLVLSNCRMSKAHIWLGTYKLEM